MNRKYRKTIVAGNWKMNMLASGVRGFADALKGAMPEHRRCGVIVCVPFPLIPAAVRAFRDSRISVGAQNVNENESGAYTGEVSAAMLTDLGVKYVIIGHSERRRAFGDSDELVGMKIKSALASGLHPILCVGESLRQRNSGTAIETVAIQVKTALAGLTPAQVKKLIIAYEPVWAIGTGNNAAPDDANSVCRAIRSVVRGLYDARVARAITIQYGGSASSSNAAELFAQPDIDGALVGSASLNPEEFAAIISAAAGEQ